MSEERTLTADDYTGPAAVAEPPKPKRKRRTKAQMEAENPLASNPNSSHIAGSDLVPDLSAPAPEVTAEFVYWVGVTHDCPVNHIVCAGNDFPMATSEIILDPRDGKRKLSNPPGIGGFARLTRTKIERMRDDLKRLVIRTYPNAKDDNETGDRSKNIGDPIRRARRGQIIRIPRASDFEVARKEGRSINPYIPQAGDVPAARYMFAVPCEDQKHPKRGTYYPPSLEEAGLHWAGVE